MHNAFYSNVTVKGIMHLLALFLINYLLRIF